MVASAEALDQSLGAAAFTADPYPTYAALRDTDPVHWSDAWSVWVLTRYVDIHRILKQPHLFSNAGRFEALMDQLPGSAQEDVAAVVRHNSAGMLQSDPPDHTRLRQLVRNAFTPRVIEEMKPRVQNIVDQLLDELHPLGRADFIDRFAFRLPLTVICDIMNLPVSDSERFLALGNDIASVQATGRADLENAKRGARAVEEIEDYFRAIIQDRMRHPGTDLISRMVLARDQGDQLSEDELVGMCVNFLFAGHQTTEHLIGNGLFTLLRHPDQLARLQVDGGLVQSAVEECLRYESPIQRGWRRATADIEFEGKQISNGDLLFLMLGSANRDPAIFERPDTFDIGRSPNRHLAFGHGIHFCIGAPLARLEAPIAISTVLARFPSLRVGDEPEWEPNVHLRGLRSLTLAW